MIISSTSFLLTAVSLSFKGLDTQSCCLIGLKQVLIKPFFCFLMEKSEHPKDCTLRTSKLQPKKKSNSFCIRMDRRTKWNLQVEIFAHFLRFWTNFYPCFWSPLNYVHSLLWRKNYSYWVPFKYVCSLLQGKMIIIGSPLNMCVLYCKETWVIGSPDTYWVPFKYVCSLL